MSIWLALILVTLCAVLWDAGIVLQKLAVDDLPPLRMGARLPRALGRLLTSRRWMAGLVASAAGWGLFAWALAFTPVSMARAIQGSGFVILAVASMLVLRHRLRGPEWLGVGLVTAGVVALGLTGGTSGGGGRIDFLGAVPGLAACGAAGAGACILAAVTRARAGPVTACSILAGVLLGLGDVFTRALLLELGRPDPLPAAAVVAACMVAFYVTGFLVLSRAYQLGRAIVATAVSDLCSRLVAILMGITALGEMLPADSGSRLLTLCCFAAIAGGAVLLARFGAETLASQLPRHADQGERSIPTEIDPHG